MTSSEIERIRAAIERCHDDLSAGIDGLHVKIDRLLSSVEADLQKVEARMTDTLEVLNRIIAKLEKRPDETIGP